MSDTPESQERRKGSPTPKMVEAAKGAAARHGVSLPENYETDFEVCKTFLDLYLAKPSPKALSFAERIAKDKGLELPDSVRSNAKELSAWIDANR
ncbi:hypothetical protein [Burkholderia ambifaria]|uniref:hypothetical protein n=1 Tax=Burkholderia ambifaria TaxID=152480 RepID=UPI000F80071E|nr:hypothetical protein [Burkholderia ambifaria]